MMSMSDLKLNVIFFTKLALSCLRAATEEDNLCQYNLDFGLSSFSPTANLLTTESIRLTQSSIGRSTFQNERFLCQDLQERQPLYSKPELYSCMAIARSMLKVILLP